MIVQKKADDARAFSNEVIPLMVYQSTQGGRMYLMAYRPWGKYFLALRFDYIVAMKTGEVYEAFDQKRAEFEELRNQFGGCRLSKTKSIWIRVRSM